MKDLIVERVIKQYKERSKVGIEKYNTTLEKSPEDFISFLTHLSEELQDATLYIEKIKHIYEQEKKV